LYENFNINHLLARYFYDTLFTENNYTFVITNSCFTAERECNLTLFVFDKKYDLITTYETVGRHSKPFFQIKNIISDKDIEILVTTPDNPSANTFEDVLIEVLKFNYATKKIVVIFGEITYSLSFMYECSRRKWELSYKNSQIYVKEAYTKLVCDDENPYVNMYKLKELAPTVIINYVYVWDKKAFKFVKK
jgi:hypothetical protein